MTTQQNDNRDPHNDIKQGGSVLNPTSKTMAYGNDSGESRSPVVTADALRELASTGVVRNVSLSGGSFKGMDLNGVRFENVDARAADFTDSVLSDSSWASCLLQEACFDHADVSGASFTDCDASQSSFAHAYLHSGWWQNCSLDGTNLTQADLGRTTVEQCRLSGVRLPAEFCSVVLSRCDLMGLEVSNARWFQVQVRDSNLSNACFTNVVFEQTAFNECAMQDADFKGLKGEYVVFHHCGLTQARFAGAHLPGAMFDLSRLDRADFTHTFLQGARFYRANAADACFAYANLDFADASHVRAPAAQLNGASVHMLNVHAADLTAASWQGCDRRTVRGDDDLLRAAEAWKPDSRWIAPIKADMNVNTRRP